MSKRFLTWGFAALLVVAFCSVAFADVPRGDREGAVYVFDDLAAKAAPLAAGEAVALDQRTVGQVANPQTPDAGCQTLLNTCQSPFYIWTLPHPSNTRIAMAEGFLPDPGASATPCTVKTISVVVYDWIDTGAKVDMDVTIHADDGSGLPGAALGTVTVPAATIDANLFAWLGVDFSAQNIVIPAGQKFHAVVTCPTATAGVSGVVLLSDGGTDDPACIEGAANTNGSVFYTSVGVWESHATHFGGFQFGTFLAADVCCEPIPPECFTLLNTCQSPFYIWTLPHPSNTRIRMAEGFDLDPTGTRECTVKTAYVVVYDWIDTGAKVDMDVSIYGDDGSGLPGTALATVTVPAAVIDANLFAWLPVDFSTMNVTAPPGGRLHVVLEAPTATAGVSGVVILSDGGTDDPACIEGAANTKGSVFYSSVGAWESHATHFGGFQFGTFIAVDVCCPPLLFALCSPGADADWATAGNNYARTYSTSAGMSSLCGINQLWTKTAGNSIATNTPVIAGGKVLISTFNALECRDQTNGNLIWTFTGFPYMGDDNRCVPTVDVANGRVYVGGAAFKSFSCVDLNSAGPAATVIWSRNSGGAPDVPLAPSPGLTRFAPSVIVGTTVVTVDESGNVYFLDAATGADVLPFTTLPDALNGQVPYNALTTDGVGKVWVGTGNSVFSDGQLHQLDVTTGLVNWTLSDPSAIFTGDANKYGSEGFPGGFAYEGGILYYFSQIRASDLNLHFPNSGAVGAIDVTVENGSGNGILWVYTGDMAAATLTGPLASQPALGPGMVYCHARGYFGSDRDGIHAFDKAIGTEIWFRDYYSLGENVAGDVQADIRSYVPVSVFCQPDQTPYLFAGDFSGRWRLINGNTGAQVWERNFGSIVLGTAIADDYAVVACRYAGAGTITAFQVGPDRPRLHLNTPFVFRTAVPGDGAVSGDLTDVISNTGCLPLNVSAYNATNPIAVRVSSVNPNLRASATRATAEAYGYDGFLSALSDKQIALLSRDIDPEVAVTNTRTFDNNARAAVDPLFLSVNTTPGAIAPGASQTLNVTWDEGVGLLNNTLYTNFIEIASDDPDYFPEDPSGTTMGLPAIQFQLFIGCPDENAYMTLGLGEEWITNHGRTSDGGGNGFHVNGNDYHFDGSMAMVVGDNSAWAIEGISVSSGDAAEWGPTLPCGVNIGSGTYGTDVVDTVSYNLIDLASSLGFFSVGSRQMGGVLLNVQHVGSQDAAFGDFSLVKVTITNEADGSGTLNDIYFGTGTDWDIAPFAANNAEVYSFGYAAHNSGAGTKGDATAVAGHARLDGDAIGAAVLQSGGSAGDFMMGDFFGYAGSALDSAVPFNIMSDPANFVSTFYPSVSVGNDDIGVYASMLHIPSLAEGASETFYYCTYQLDNGTNGLAWADDAGFDAAVNEIVCRAKAFAGFAKGDANCDGVVDLADVVLVGNIIDGLYSPAGTGGQYSADANGDGTIDETDYDLLYDVVAGVQPASALANGWRF